MLIIPTVLPWNFSPNIWLVPLYGHNKVAKVCLCYRLQLRSCSDLADVGVAFTKYYWDKPLPHTRTYMRTNVHILNKTLQRLYQLVNPPISNLIKIFSNVTDLCYVGTDGRTDGQNKRFYLGHCRNANVPKQLRLPAPSHKVTYSLNFPFVITERVSVWVCVSQKYVTQSRYITAMFLLPTGMADQSKCPSWPARSKLFSTGRIMNGASIVMEAAWPLNAASRY
jgi:hypothetical protein